MSARTRMLALGASVLLASAQASGQARSSLLFYEASSGEGEFYATDGQGGIQMPGPRQTGWSHTWSAIVRGDFNGDARSDLLFYDPATGQGEFYATDGRGGHRSRRWPEAAARS